MMHFWWLHDTFFQKCQWKLHVVCIVISEILTLFFCFTTGCVGFIFFILLITQAGVGKCQVYSLDVFRLYETGEVILLFVLESKQDIATKITVKIFPSSPSIWWYLEAASWCSAAERSAASLSLFSFSSGSSLVRDCTKVIFHVNLVY